MRRSQARALSASGGRAPPRPSTPADARHVRHPRWEAPVGAATGRRPGHLLCGRSRSELPAGRIGCGLRRRCRAGLIQRSLRYALPGPPSGWSDPHYVSSRTYATDRPRAEAGTKRIIVGRDRRRSDTMPDPSRCEGDDPTFEPHRTSRRSSTTTSYSLRAPGPSLRPRRPRASRRANRGGRSRTSTPIGCPRVMSGR